MSLGSDDDARGGVSTPGVRLSLSIGAVLAALAFVLTLAQAVFAAIRSDYLADRSEAAGGFDPAVFPPFDSAAWLLAMVAPVVSGALLIVLIVLRLHLERLDPRSERVTRVAARSGSIAR